MEMARLEEPSFYVELSGDERGLTTANIVYLMQYLVLIQEFVHW